MQCHISTSSQRQMRMTVVTEYEPVKARSDSCQSEAELEKEFIYFRCEQGYTYPPIHTGKNLISNLRAQLEALNNCHFSDDEWELFSLKQLRT